MATRAASARASARRTVRPRPRGRRPVRPAAPGWLRIGIEGVALLVTALIVVLAGLGAVAARIAGTGLWANLLPFAGTVLALGIAAALALRGWLTARRWLAARAGGAPALVAGGVAATLLVVTTGPGFHARLADLRRVVGGTKEAERVTVAHQVFAAYRRTDLGAMHRLLERARVYEPTVLEAAGAFGVDPEILMGIGAAESAFYPRDSADGGRGLFQITAPPAEAVAAVRERVGAHDLDPLNQRHNAFLAAATLRRYLDDMHGDPFLALLAYNIGPRNGGLRTVMGQYGARDFVTIQPYLQNLPRDYPIRVLSAALAYRLWRHEGRLPRYEDADNARRIQQTGVPGLDAAAG